MREFKQLNPQRPLEGFDAEVHGEEPTVKVEESKGRIVISYTFPGFYLSDDVHEVEGRRIPFKQVNIAATGFLSGSGRPLLPSFGRYVQIPFNCNYTCKVKTGKSVQFDDILVLPSQENIMDGPEEEHVFEYDKGFYRKDVPYPKEIVEITGPFNLDEYRGLLIHVRPFQYNPAKKRLTGHTSVTVTIDVKPKKAKALEYSIADPATDREAFGNLFLNPRRRIEDRLAFPPIRTHFRLRGPEFLIIYHEKFKKAADKLAKWKNTRGLRTKTVSINTVGNSVAKIKGYIRNASKAPSRLRHVLLFGDVNTIKTENITGGKFGSNVTDYYYSTDTDPKGPRDCVLPRLSIGRIPVRTAKEAMAVADQTISYEKNPPVDHDYYDRMSFAAYFQDSSHDGKADRGYMKTMESIREHMTTLGFDVERIYVSDNPNPQLYRDGTPVPQEVVDAITDPTTATNALIDATTEGQLMTAHRDHGDDNGWAHPSFKMSHLNNITSDVPTMFYSINCLTGHFDLSGARDCFAEKILKMKGGAPSLIAATRLSHTWLNDSLMKALFDAMWGGVLPTFPGTTTSYPVKRNRLGDVLNYGKSYLPVKKSGSPEAIKDHFEIYHVVGDPTIELWRDQPLQIRLRAILSNGFLSIKLSACPKNSVITVWWKDKMLKRLEPSSTHMKVALKDILPPPRPGRRPIRPGVSVCFWAPGYRFCQVMPKPGIGPLRPPV